MESVEWIEKITGMVSLLLFIVANAYYPVRWIFSPNRLLPLTVELFLNKYRDIHMWLNALAFLLISLNASVSGNRNLFLYMSLLVTVWLTIAGFLLRVNLFSANYRKRVRLLYSQQTVLVGWLVLRACGKL